MRTNNPEIDEPPKSAVYVYMRPPEYFLECIFNLCALNEQKDLKIELMKY